jgi:predicted ATPase/class 3 adenylate cyclase
MSDLPAGTVTFLFTDIEGSTRLLHELGAEAYASELAEHRRVLRAAFEQHGGVEVDTQGDAFFVAFPTAPGAVEAAREAQAAVGLPVRMGLHTGTPLLTEEGYIGPDVHRAARIAAAGHGRQVLVSTATATLVDQGELRDLGEHRLKDLSAPERIFQLGDGEFPPLKTLYRTNLPIPATPFLGREHELAEVRELLERDDVRLLALTGAGGSGKTRLALHAAGEVAEAYPDGVWWVPLAPLTEADDVMPAAARALGGAGPVAELLGDRRLLLLFDNFEHVVGAAARLAALLGSCPNVDVLVTSRERLRVQGEQVYPVPVLARDEARRFFVARARSVQPGFEPDDRLDELCARLDDLPLALELAAARTSLLTTAQLLDRLGGRLDLLKGGRDAEVRQQTLRATIEWSYELLEPEEQRLLAALAVFRGGWTLEAAEQVADADLELLQSLVDKSLVRRWETGRFAMLETIREFALERLDESGAAENLRGRLFDYLLALLPPWRATRAGLAEVIDRLGAELPNYRAALAWSLEADPLRSLELVTALGRFWVIRDPAEGDRWLTAALSRTADQPPELRAEALLWLASCGAFLGGGTSGEETFEESLSLFRAAGNLQRVADALDRLAGAQIAAGRLEAAKAAAEESLALFEELGEPEGAMYALDKVGAVARGEGDKEGARETLETVLGLAREFDDSWWAARTMIRLAVWSLDDGELARAGELTREAAHVTALLGDRFHLAESFGLLAALATARGDFVQAGRFWGVLEALEREREWLDPESRAGYSARVDAARGPDFAAAAEHMRELAPDDAVRVALAEID